MSIIIALLSSQWFWTSIITPFILYLISKITKNYDKDSIKKSLDILYQIVVYACNYAENENKKGNIVLSKRDFALQYVKQNIPDTISKIIPNYLDIAKSMIEKYLNDDAPDKMKVK
jgi:hypothetical protein